MRRPQIHWPTFLAEASLFAGVAMAAIAIGITIYYVLILFGVMPR